MNPLQQQFGQQVPAYLNQIQPRHGTTILGILYRDGVLLAADRKTTAGNIMWDTHIKIAKITDKIWIANSGNVADIEKLADLLRAEMQLYEFEKEVPPTASVCVNLLSNILYSGYRNYMPYIVGPLVIGKDEDSFKLFDLEAAGSFRKKDDFAFSGSGLIVTMGILEDSFKKNMTKEEAIHLAVRAIRAASRRDIGSGEGMDIVYLDKDGEHELAQEEIQKVLSSLKKQ